MRSAQEVKVGRANQQDNSDASDDEGLGAPISSLQQAELHTTVLPAEGLNFRAQIVAGKAARKKAAVEAEQEATAAVNAVPANEASSCPFPSLYGVHANSGKLAAASHIGGATLSQAKAELLMTMQSVSSKAIVAFIYCLKQCLGIWVTVLKKQTVNP